MMASRPAGAADNTQTGDKIALQRFSEYSKCIMTMISAILLAYYPAKRDISTHASPSYFKVCCGLLLVTFLADVPLLLLTSKSLGHGRTIGTLEISPIYVTNILAMLTSASLLLLLNTVYAMLAILLPPIVAIVGIAFYEGARASTDQPHGVAAYESHQPELKQSFDLSALVTIAALGGMLGGIVGYFKNFPKDVDQVPVKFSMAFLFFTVMFGLLSMLLTTVPPLLRNPNAGLHFVAFVKVLSYALFGLLALAGLAAAAEFVGEFILLAFFPIFLALVFWFRELFIQEDETDQPPSATGGENDISSTIIPTFIFAVMMLVYSYFNSEDFHFKICMFFMSMAFVPSLSWMVLAFRHRGIKSLETVVNILIYFTIPWFVLAMLDLIFFVIIN